MPQDPPPRRNFTASEKPSSAESPRPEDIENFFPSLFRQPLAGVVNINLEGRVTLANDRFGEILGIPAAELRGMSVASLTYPDDIPETLNAFSSVVNNRNSYILEKRYIRSDGSFVWALSSVTPVFNEQGDVSSVIALVQEISARKRAELETAAKQAYFQGLVDLSPAIIWMTDAESRCIYLSKPWYEFTGRTPEQDLGFGWLDNVHPEDLPATDSVYRAVTEAKGILSVDYRLRRRDGTYRWVTDSGHPRFGNDGAFLGYVGTLVDVHEQKLTTERLAESQQQLELLTNFTPQIIWTARPDGKLDWYNERWYEFTGFPRGTSGDLSWEPILHPDDVKKCYEGWYSSVKSGLPYKIEYRFRDRRSGDYRWYLGEAVPLRNAEGRITRWFGTCVDIHDQKTLSEELKRTVQARDEFLSIASHELRTPLTTLKLQAQTMERAIAKGRPEVYSKERVGAFARQTARQVSRLSRLVDDMLDVSRIRTGTLALAYQAFDLSDLTREVAERLSQQLAAETDEETTVTAVPCPGRWDPLRMEQVITNLLTNAIRYGRRRAVTIEVKPVAETGRVRLIVRDQGGGVPVASREKIFEPYERAGMSASEVSGLGLGLYITKQIVEAHGGTIQVEGVAGEGARFVVELPAEPPAN